MRTPQRKETAMNAKIALAKKFVADHKVAFSVTATALACLSLNRFALRQHNDFLKEHDLYVKFYLED